jgi:hypothetical protein
VVIEPRYGVAGAFQGGRAVVGRIDPEKRVDFSYVDRTGATAFEVTCAAASSFHEGLARVLVKGRMGYIDRRGRRGRLHQPQGHLRVEDEGVDALGAVGVRRHRLAMRTPHVARPPQSSKISMPSAMASTM